MLTDYHRQLFERADSYYAALEAGLVSKRKKRAPRWPIALGFIAGVLVTIASGTLVTSPNASALPAQLAVKTHVAAPSHLVQDEAKYRQQQRTAYAEAIAKANAKAARKRRLALILASEDQNPFRAINGLVPARVDMGVDYYGYGSVYAVGPGIIQNTYNGGWPGGGFICEYLTGGRWAGNSVYMAESVSATVGYGQQVSSDTIIGTINGWIETGWAQGGCAGNALAGYYPGYPTSAGISYNGVLVSLGAPSGTGVSGAGPFDAGKPSGASHACGWRCYPRNRAMDWALTQHGCSYYYGGTGCSPGYDCSGLVMMAYKHIGINLPRTTYDMLNDVGVRHYRRHFWWELVQVWHPKRGDLAFYGSGHVELKSKWRNTTYGAHDWGTTVGWIKWSQWWHPTAFYRVEVHSR